MRVLRSGGTLGLLSWTPEGFIGQLFATMKPFSPPPPAGAQPPPLWGDEEHVRVLLGGRVTGLSAERRTVTVTRFPGASDFRAYFGSHYGPTMATYAFNAADADRVAALDDAIDALAARFTKDGVMEWEYLLLTATRT